MEVKNNEKPPNLLLNFSFILAIFLTSLHIGTASSRPVFSPADHYLINCGSSSPSAALSDHRVFNGDESHDDSNQVHLSATHSFSLVDPYPSRVTPPIYNSARIFTRPSSYAFRIKERGTHLVRLHFRLLNSSTRVVLTDAQFHVSAGEFLLLKDFTGQLSTQDPEIKEYVVPVDTHELVISFIPSGNSKFAFVNAIEVVSAPKDLISDVAQFVDADGGSRFDGLSKNALETMYRVNVGGPKVTPFNDTLWRTWVPDDDGQFLSSAEGSERVHFSGRIQYGKGGASREVAPDYVYSTGRVLRAANVTNPRSIITWTFPVTDGYKYLVRAHFCDIASPALGLLYFNVYVNGFLASENLDLSSVTKGRLASPFYADFVVDGGSSSGVLTVAVGPSNWSVPHEIDAILNGVEIMKLNNSMGSLDGKFCLQSVLANRPRGGVGFVLSLVAGICLLVAGLVVMYRQISSVRDNVAWSRLPMDVSEIKLKSGNF